ncbi:MAG: carbohydrate ABC transporter substrate-binding protein, partial [Lapillicoccus sp.]
MARPATEAEYLARLVPASSAGMSRRSLLRGALGAGAMLATPSLLAACSSSPSGSSGGGTAAATGTVTLGSNQSDAVPKAAVQSVVDAFQKANSGLTVKLNTIDHNTFQENINNYLQG